MRRNDTILNRPGSGHRESRGLPRTLAFLAVLVLATGVATVTASATASADSKWWMEDPACDPQWCRFRFIAYEAADRADMVTVVWAAAISYDVVEWAPWMVATAVCESGLRPQAWSGWYVGLFQHDPWFWWGRAAAAGLPGADPWDPVNNAQVTAWMLKAGYGWRHWPVCGNNGLQP